MTSSESSSDTEQSTPSRTRGSRRVVKKAGPPSSHGAEDILIFSEAKSKPEIEAKPAKAAGSKTPTRARSRASSKKDQESEPAQDSNPQHSSGRQEGASSEAEAPKKAAPRSRRAQGGGRAKRAGASKDPVGNEQESAAEDQATPKSEPAVSEAAPLPMTALLFQPPQPTAAPRRKKKAEPKVVSALDEIELPEASSSDQASDAESADSDARKRKRGSRGKRGKGATSAKPENEPREGHAEPNDAPSPDGAGEDSEDGSSSRRRRRRRRQAEDSERLEDQVTALKGSTRLEAKRQRRREGRDAGRKKSVITEAEFLARRESVARTMVVRENDGHTQIAVLEDNVLVEHYVSRRTQHTIVGNVYLGRVQNVLPSMEAAFVDIGRGRNAVLYAGEVNWDAAGLEGQPRRIEQALKSGDPVLVQVTKDPIGHKGARLTAQVTLAGRHLVLVPGGGMTGISRKLPDTERNRLKKLLKKIVPEDSGVIVRTAAEGASEDELTRDVERLAKLWEKINKKQSTANAPALLQAEPDLAIRVVRDVFNEDVSELVVSGAEVSQEITSYIEDVAPEMAGRIVQWSEKQDVFAHYRVDEQLAKGMDRKVWLPSGGSLVIDRTEAMTVIDVNTGKFTGSAGSTLEETVTMNNLEAVEEIVRQLRLRDIGGIIVVDFIDMVLESNRDLVLRRLVECLSRDRTRHQVAEVTSLGLIQMTRKRVGQGLVEAFSETCECCHGRGFIVHTDPVEKGSESQSSSNGGKRKKKVKSAAVAPESSKPSESVAVLPEKRQDVNAALASIAAAAAQAHDAKEHEESPEDAPKAPSKPRRATRKSSVTAPKPKTEENPQDTPQVS